MKAYQNTNTPAARSQEDIRKILIKYGADGMQFSEDRKNRIIVVRFMYTINQVEYFVSFKVPIPEVDFKTPTGRERKGSQVAQLQAQHERGIWRAVFWAIKSRMEAVEFGIETFQEAFLSHFEIQGTDKSIGDVLIPRLATGGLKALVDMRGKA